eukprot:752296-Hanusia_phi.AAC.1
MDSQIVAKQSEFNKIDAENTSANSKSWWIKSAMSSLISMLQSGVKKDYNIDDDEIGKGKFGIVKRAINKRTGQMVAMKIMSKRDRDTKELRNFRREAEIMKTIDHPNCVRMYDFYESKNHIYIAMELVNGGQLLDRIIQKDHYSETEAANVFVQMIEAIDYLHQKGIVHRDLKPENILYSSKEDNSPIKICDFGLGRIVNLSDIQAERIRLWSRCGSPNYVAPEVLQHDGYGMECDVWSAGVILFICLSGMPPFDQLAVHDKFKSIKAGRYSFDAPQWSNISSEAKDLISHMLNVDAHKRFSCKQCLQHPWVRKFHAGTLSKDAMPQMQSRLKDWNATRKLMAAVHTCAALRRMASNCVLPTESECLLRLAEVQGDPVRKAELKASFDLLDRESKGRISLKNLSATLRCMGERKDENTLREMIRNFDVFRTGDLCFDEYCIMMCHTRPRTISDPGPPPDLESSSSQPCACTGEELDSLWEAEEEIYDAFQAMDVLNEGGLSSKSLKEALARFGCEVTDEEVADIILAGDRNQDGLIDFEEFKALIFPNDSFKELKSVKKEDSDDREFDRRISCP